MSTLSTIKTQLNAILARANAKTAKSDKTVNDAVDSLIDGYGKGEEPTGTINITSNGTHNVKDYASANVNVPASGITPSGTKEITANGEHDVTQYAKVNVNVPTSSEEPTNVVRRIVTLSDMTGKSAYYPTLLTGDDFVKQYYSNDAFFILMRPLSVVAGSAYAVTGLYHGNRLLIDGSSDFYGFAIQYSSAGTAQAFFGNTAKVSGTGYNCGFRAKSNGNVDLVLPANRNIKAGEYELIIGCM